MIKSPKPKHRQSPLSRAASTAASESAGHFLVVIDHREARVYKAELHGSIPQHITPLDPTGSGRYLHNVGDDSNGQRRRENKSFYEAIAQLLRQSTEILLFGSGTGSSSAMEYLNEVLQKKHPDIAKRIVGSITIDAQHLTEDQLLAKAREFYEARAPAETKRNAPSSPRRATRRRR